MKFICNRRDIYSVLLLLSFYSLSFAADKPTYGVLYPKSHGSYQAVFKSVIADVENELNASVNKMTINEVVEPGLINNWIKTNDIKVLVSLGKQGLDVCEGLTNEVQLIAGAILSPPDNGCQIRGGIALAPHPDGLFNWLLRLKPDARSVHVVYNPEFNGWLIKYAIEAAKDRGLKLVTYQAYTLDEAAKIYRQIVDKGLSSVDSIWLPQDPYTVDQKTVLPVLLQEAWNNEFVVFSSNAAHVKRGVLFGLYPDFEAMGTSLGKMALRVAASDSIKISPIQPLTDLLIAVNLRTADHLKLNLNSSERNMFDLTYPASH
ncbi:MAG: hypothetical protein JXA04_10980 [Gammaproteobacteria bacterium]|nr:hypothetical protein [Gammaproteobacteria bacterium]